MRTILISLFFAFSMAICNAQIAPPMQTDTLIITSVKYNYADIDNSNWPCEVIYKSTQDIRIGSQTFNIVKVDKIGDVIYFIVYDADDHSKKEYQLKLTEKRDGTNVISFSGYEFNCFKKEEVIEETSSDFNCPSVLRYNLDGRKASKLPIPTGRCDATGEVTVIISVNSSGAVTNAVVKDDISTNNECLRSFAIRAARLSRFSAVTNGGVTQRGEIVYVFGNNKSTCEPNVRLAGRSVNGTLPRPSYGVQADGKVVVKIWVDQYGNVTKAQSGAEGTTATDKTLWQAAYKAAMAAHFNMDASAPTLQEGTITYIFSMR